MITGKPTKQRRKTGSKPALSQTTLPDPLLGAWSNPPVDELLAADCPIVESFGRWMLDTQKQQAQQTPEAYPCGVAPDASSAALAKQIAELFSANACEGLLLYEGWRGELRAKLERVSVLVSEAREQSRRKAGAWAGVEVPETQRDRLGGRKAQDAGRDVEAWRMQGSGKSLEDIRRECGYCTREVARQAVARVQKRWEELEPLIRTAGMLAKIK